MANTQKIILSDEWIEIGPDNSEGFMTIESTQSSILYRESDSLPAPSVNDGHTLNTSDGTYSFVSWALELGQKVYAKSVHGDSTIQVTLK